MKTLNKIIPLAFVCLGLTSCLKDELYTADTTKAPNLVEFSAEPDATAGEGFIYPLYSQSFNFVDQADMPITINFAGTNPAPTDIVVDIQVDASSLTKFNAAAGEELYTLAPARFYSIPSNQVTIKKGERTATFMIKVNPKQMDFEHEYVIPLVIKSATGTTVSGNFGTALFQVVPRNQYDGIYTVTGSSVRGGDPVLTGAFPEQSYQLITVGANAVRMSRVPVWADGNNIGGIGPWTFTLNPATNAITISDALNPAVVNNTADPNRYDPATRTFSISGYWGTGPTNRAWKADFKYVGPRP